MSCEKCNGAGYVVIEVGDTSAVRRCKCHAVLPPSEPDTITEEEATAVANAICEVLAFSPVGLGRSIIADAIRSMCRTQEQAVWVAKAVCMIYKNWSDCGIPGIRQAYCSKYKPKDGVEVFATDRYPDGFPGQHLQLEARKPLMIGPGEKMSEDPIIHKVAEIAVAVQRLKDKATWDGPARPEEIAAAPLWLRKLEGYE